MRANANTLLRARGVELVPYRPEHVERYHAWMASEDLLAATASERLTLEEEIEMQREWARDESKCTFIVRDGASKEMIGDVNLFFNDHDDPKRAEIEIMIADARFRRKGLAIDALEVFMAYGVIELGVTAYVAKIGFDNVASNALFARKLGYAERSKSTIFEETTYELRTGVAAEDGNIAHERFVATWASVEVDSYDDSEAKRASATAC